MAEDDDAPNAADANAVPPPGAGFPDPDAAGRADRGVGDLFRRAVSAGFEAATRSKDEVVRVATTEIRSWLDRLDLDTEIVKALSKMTIEVKGEIRFRPKEDGGLVPEMVHETKIKQGR